MLTTDTTGFSNFGASSEQAETSTRANTRAKPLGINNFWRSHGNMEEMIPVISSGGPPAHSLRRLSAACVLFCAAAGAGPFANGAAEESPAIVSAPIPAPPTTNCLETGDGYLRAHVAGAIEANIDWPNSGTRCQGESKNTPAGIRLSFQRASEANPNLLFVFGLSGIREGQAAHAAGVNLTVILQGTDRIFGTLGESRCTVDSLTQTPLPLHGSYRIEARGFCVQPAHAVRGDGDVLVSTFEFAGPVNYGEPEAH
jgi:hypothetical protein